MAEQARELLRQLQQFAHSAEFDPARWKASITIAANDFQRDLLLPALATRLREQAPGVLPSNVPTLDMLRADTCQLVISPRPPDGTDVLQKRLFETEYRAFYDAAVPAAPSGKADYLAADHATVAYEAHRGLDIDQQLEAQSVVRRFVVKVPGMSALPAFVKGSHLLVTAPELLERTSFAGLAHC